MKKEYMSPQAIVEIMQPEEMIAQSPNVVNVIEGTDASGEFETLGRDAASLWNDDDLDD